MSRFSGYSRAPGDAPHFSTHVTFPPDAGTKDKTVTRRLLIDNRDRHNYPSSSPFNFKIYLGNDSAQSVGIAGYENVVSVELKAIAIPKVANERYVILSISELNDDMLDATSSAAHNAFAVVYFDSDSLAPGMIKPLKGADFYLKQFMFRPALAKLNTLSIKLLKHDGTVISTSDTNNESHVSMVLEVTVRSNRREA